MPLPRCSRRAERCDVDHVIDWAHGGPTDHQNLIHLCRKHHRLKHTTGWTVEPAPIPQVPDDESPPGDPTGTSRRSTTPTGAGTGAASAGQTPSVASADVVRWTSPTGRQYLDHAAREIATEHSVRRHVAAKIAARRAAAGHRDRPGSGARAKVVGDHDGPGAVAAAHPDTPPF